MIRCSHALLGRTLCGVATCACRCPECGWELLCVWTVGLDGRPGWRFFPLQAPLADVSVAVCERYDGPEWS